MARKRPDLSARNKANAIHGMASSRTYRIWNGLKRRCLNPNDKDFHNYGGRGIEVCERWKKSFTNFLQDMGEAPANMSIDRIDNNAGYSKDNCRWATISDQANNRRTCIMITFLNETKSIAEWSRSNNIERKTLEYRIRKGWNIEKALTTPSLIKRK